MKDLLILLILKLIDILLTFGLLNQNSTVTFGIINQFHFVDFSIFFTYTQCDMNKLVNCITLGLSIYKKSQNRFTYNPIFDEILNA